MSPVPAQWAAYLDERDAAIRAEHRAGASVADLSKKWSLSRGHIGTLVWRGGRKADRGKKP